MPAKLRYLWDLVLNSYWFLPTVMTAGAIALSVFTLHLDSDLERETIRELGSLSAWIYTGGVDGAREVLSTIAGSMITVAGVVFSITIVALTLASSQFGPRVLASFMRDRGNQVVLGAFISTFIYSLLVLRTIRSGSDSLPQVVPHLSVTVALASALGSIGVLIYFIHHVARAIQAPNLIAAIAMELHHAIDRSTEDEPARPPPDSLLLRAPEAFEREASIVTAPRDGYIQAIEIAALTRAAAERHLLFRVEHRPGQFVAHGSPLVRIWPAAEADEELKGVIRGSVVLGPSRTAIQDMEFMVHQLVEVAVRALSPGINDPFTALTCIDRLGAEFCHMVGRSIPSPYLLDDRGELRVVLQRPLTFAGIADAAFHQIRQNAAHHASIYLRLLETLAEVVDRAGTPEQLEVLSRHADLVLQAAEAGVAASQDRDEVGERFEALTAALRRGKERVEPAP